MVRDSAPAIAMGRGVRALIAMMVLASPSGVRAAPDPVIRANAQLSIILNRGPNFMGSTPMTVAYHEGFHTYYSAMGGSPSYSGFTWNSGSSLMYATTPLNLDARAIFYNPNSGGIEVVTYNAMNAGSGGMASMGLSVSGILTANNTTILGALPGLGDSQTAPAYDPARDLLYARQRSSDTVNVVGHADGLLKGQIILNMAAAGSPIIAGEDIGYDSAYEVFVTVDTLGNRALVHRRDGSYLGACSLPNYTPQQINWNMGYANGQLFVFDYPNNEWFGYRIFGPASVTLASTAAATYALFSTAVIANDNSPATVVNPQLGTPDSTVWRLGHWIPDQAAFAMAGPFYTSIGREVTSLDAGQGYWLATKTAKTVLMSGDPVMSGFEVSLKDGPSSGPGWNQLGNPLLNPIPVSGLRVRSGTTTVLLTDPAYSLTDHVIWTWNGSQYTSLGAGAMLPAGAGFWLRKVATGDVRVVFEGPGAGSAPVAPASSAPLWDVALTARQGESASTPLTLGVANVARDAWNPLAMALPPSPPGRHLRLAVAQTQWGAMSGDYASAYVTPDAPAAWDFQLGGGDAPGEIELRLDGHNVPMGTRFRLLDLAQGTSWDLALGQTIAVIATPRDRPLRLVAIAPSDGSVAAPALAMRAYPNPFTQRTGLEIPVARTGDLRVGIYDVRGRRVRVLERDLAPAGSAVLVWDGRDQSGADVPAGLYFARSSVGGRELGVRIVKTR
jgi:hypothetical protein